MKQYKCSIKGYMSSDDCYNCFKQQESKYAISRVLCQRDHAEEIKVESTPPIEVESVL